MGENLRLGFCFCRDVYWVWLMLFNMLVNLFFLNLNWGYVVWCCVVNDFLKDIFGII